MLDCKDLTSSTPKGRGLRHRVDKRKYARLIIKRIENADN